MGGRRLRGQGHRLRDAAQVAKIDEVRGELPELAPRPRSSTAPPRVRSRWPIAEPSARGGDDAELDRRAAAVGPDDACLIIYTSGTTGRPEGRRADEPGLRRRRAARRSRWSCSAQGDVVYLYLPLAHVFAQLVQADCIEVGATIAYWGGDTTQIVAELGPGQADRAAVGARASSRRSTRSPWAWSRRVARRRRRRPSPSASRCARPASVARTVSAEEAAEFERVDGEMFALVRGIFGGRIKLAISGAAPIAPEILEFFYAAGVPVFEGWGMTETTSIGTLNLPGRVQVRHHRPAGRRRRRAHRRGRRDRDGRRDDHARVLAQPGRHRRGR